MKVIGLMSGTSLDGIDAALVEFGDSMDEAPDWHVVAFTTTPLTSSQRDQIHSAIVHGSPATLCRLHADLGEWFATAVLNVCASANIGPYEIAAVGSHGQTIWHEPPAGG